MSKRLLFYATKDDLALLMGSVEQELALDYVLMGRHGTQLPDRFRGIDNVPSLGEVTADSATASAEYLAVLKGSPISVRSVPQTDGTVGYFVDQLVNESSVTFAPGGFLGSDVLLHGRIATVSTEDPISRLLFNRFERSLRRSFKKIKAYWVGPQAERLLGTATRLTISAQAAAEFDLVR